MDEQQPDSPPAPTVVASPDRPGKPNSLGRIVAVLWKPLSTFESIAARPTWAVALLVIVVVSAISASIWIPSIDVEELIRRRLESSQQNVDAAQLESVIQFTSRLRWLMFLGPIVFFQPVAFAVVALVFYLVFRVTGSEQRYQQSLAVTVHSFMPLAVAALLAIPLLLSRGSISADEVMSGGVLASNLGFLAGEDASPATVALLQSLDFFSLWSIVLLGIGYSRSTGLPRLSVAISVVAMWALWILARVGMASAAG
jgi:Yip1-like protein